jgi:hypothetical protein
MPGLRIDPDRLCRRSARHHLLLLRSDVDPGRHRPNRSPAPPDPAENAPWGRRGRASCGGARTALRRSLRSYRGRDERCRVDSAPRGCGHLARWSGSDPPGLERLTQILAVSRSADRKRGDSRTPANGRYTLPATSRSIRRERQLWIRPVRGRRARRHLSRFPPSVREAGNEQGSSPIDAWFSFG